jgi:hypothetical protein
MQHYYYSFNTYTSVSSVNKTNNCWKLSLKKIKMLIFAFFFVRFQLRTTSTPTSDSWIHICILWYAHCVNFIEENPLLSKNKKNAKMSIFIFFKLNFQQLLVLFTEETEIHWNKTNLHITLLFYAKKQLKLHYWSLKI